MDEFTFEELIDDVKGYLVAEHLDPVSVLCLGLTCHKYFRLAQNGIAFFITDMLFQIWSPCRLHLPFSPFWSMLGGSWRVMASWEASSRTHVWTSFRCLLSS